MAFNSYTSIKTKIGKACELIHDSWYIKLQTHIIFHFANYKDDEIKADQKVHKHQLTKSLQKSKRVRFANILIDRQD